LEKYDGGWYSITSFIQKQQLMKSIAAFLYNNNTPPEDIEKQF
jgi:hypothetical protein